MEKVISIKMSFEDFQKQLEIAMQKSRNEGIEVGKKAKEKEPEYFTLPELQERWKCSDQTIANYEKKHGLKRKIIGGMVRFSYKEVVRFENLLDQK